MMASAVVKIVGKRVLKDQLKESKYFRDPYYEEVAIKDKRGRTVKVKKQKRKEEFLFLPEHDREILINFRKWAFRLDNSIGNVAGLGSIIGLIPVVGDGVDFLLALWLIRCALQISGPKDAKDRKKLKKLMMANLAFDGVVGLVPIVGDVADVFFKCNTRNAVLLEHMLTKRARKEISAVDSVEEIAFNDRTATSHSTKSLSHHESSLPSEYPRRVDSSLPRSGEIAKEGAVTQETATNNQNSVRGDAWLNRFKSKRSNVQDVKRGQRTPTLRAQV